MNQDTIGLTSKTSAAARSYESKRADALFIDPLADIYTRLDPEETRENGTEAGTDERRCCCPIPSLRAKVANIVLSSSSRLNFGIGRLAGINVEQIFQDIAVRTRFFDDIIQKHLSSVKQIVLPACGGDFRPYRLPSLNATTASSELTFYLIDMPHVIAYRQKCIAQLHSPPNSLCKIVEIPSNLAKEEWSRILCEHGFRTDLATLWIAEGFLHYLNESQVTTLFNQIRQLSSSNQTSIAFDLVSSGFQTTTQRAKSGGLFQFAVDTEKDVRQVFSTLGCYDIECTSFPEIGALYGRTISGDRSFIVQAKLHPI